MKTPSLVRVGVGNPKTNQRVAVGEGGVTVSVYVAVSPVIGMERTKGSVEVAVLTGSENSEVVGVKKRLANACCVNTRSSGVGEGVKRGNSTTSSCD